MDAVNVDRKCLGTTIFVQRYTKARVYPQNFPDLQPVRGQPRRPQVRFRLPSALRNRGRKVIRWSPGAYEGPQPRLLVPAPGFIPDLCTLTPRSLNSIRTQKQHTSRHNRTTHHPKHNLRLPPTLHQRLLPRIFPHRPDVIRETRPQTRYRQQPEYQPERERDAALERGWLVLEVEGD